MTPLASGLQLSHRGSPVNADTKFIIRYIAEQQVGEHIEKQLV